MQTFEDYLQDIHASQADGVLDDDMTNDYERWLEEKDHGDLMELAEMFGQKMYKKGQKSMEEELPPAELDPRMK